MQCDPKCSEYKPCISACPLESCDNAMDQGSDQKLCVEDTCVEGCQLKACAEGKIYSNNSYVDCIPKSVCKPVCMEKNKAIYYEGDVIKSDNCQTCRCSKGKEICIGIPCPQKSILPYHTTQRSYQDSNTACVSGWTKWINQDTADQNKMKLGDKALKIGDTEPLPSYFLLKNLESSASCSYESMKQIECRTVNTHINPKVTGEDAECSLERGLLCAGPCHDYEIRVMCDCDDNIEIFTLPSIPIHPGPKTPQPSASQLVQLPTPSTPLVGKTCDSSIPHVEFPGDCYKFLHCQPSGMGWEFVEKTCGPSMMFNPISMTCDWPASVRALKPSCGQLAPILRQLPTKAPYQVIDIKECPPGKVWSDCALPCGRTCHFYGKFLHRNGACVNGHNVCEGGCVDEGTAISCPLGQLWRDNKICAGIADCTCESDDGKLVKVFYFIHTVIFVFV